MEDRKWIKQYYADIAGNIFNDDIGSNLCIVKDLVLSAKKHDHNIFFLGNGASNIIASHAVLDFTGQLNIKCYSMNEVGIITAFSNDFGYEHCMQRFLQFYSKPKDLIVLISSSGESKNVINAAEESNKNDCQTITFTGFESDNSLSRMGNVNLWVDNSQYNIVEGIHNIWITSICDLAVKDLKVGPHGHEFK